MNRLRRFIRRSTPGENSASFDLSTDQTRQVEVTARSEAEAIFPGPMPSQQIQPQGTSNVSGNGNRPSSEPPSYNEDSPPEYLQEILLVNSAQTFRNWFRASDERRDVISRLGAGDMDDDLPAMSLVEAQAFVDRFMEDQARLRYPDLEAVENQPSSPDQPSRPAERRVSITQEDWANWHETDTYRNLIHEYTLDGQSQELAYASADLYLMRTSWLIAIRDPLRPVGILGRPEPGTPLQEYQKRLRERLIGWGMSPSQIEDYLAAMYLEEEQRGDRAMMMEG